MNVEGVEILLQVMRKCDWEGIDFDNFDFKIYRLNNLFESTLEDLKAVAA